MQRNNIDNSDKEGSEQFLVLTTVTDRASVDNICASLEKANIPVLLEHVEIINDSISASGVRVLVPSHCTERAMSLLRGSADRKDSRIYH